MMGKVRTVIILLSVVSGSLAAVGLGRATVHDSHPNQCYNAKTDSYYSPGESWPMEGCGKITCEKHSWTPQLMISFVSCGVAMVRPPCYLVQDESKPYPDCCQKPVCPESNDNDNENDDEFLSSEEELEHYGHNETAYPASAENDLAGTALHFSLGRKDINVDRSDRNDLQSLEDEEKDQVSLEIPQPKELPPTFEYAVFDDDIDNGHEQRFNDVDAEDYQLV